MSKNKFKSPRIYKKKALNLPTSIVSVESAIPVFIGYTEKAIHQDGGNLYMQPVRISSLPEFETIFGAEFPETGTEVHFFENTPGVPEARAELNRQIASKYILYPSMQMFFANGGKTCYVISVDKYSDDAGTIDFDRLKAGLNAAEQLEDVTLIAIPDAMNLESEILYYGLHKVAMEQAARLRDRFVVMDVWIGSLMPNQAIEKMCRFDFGDSRVCSFGAVYYPRLVTSIPYESFDKKMVKINGTSAKNLVELEKQDSVLFDLAMHSISQLEMILPATAAVIGQYVTTDTVRGVWKAPANINLNRVLRPEVFITQSENDNLNVDPVSGKSINAIRAFTGRGQAMIWGARTLAGNDNEWRYVPARRFMIMVEQSIKKSIGKMNIEANNQDTWKSIQSIIEQYLVNLWRDGALQGVKPEQAFYISVGLNKTMTQQDILDGKLIVEIGLAAVRPAEFIIIRLLFKISTA